MNTTAYDRETRNADPRQPVVVGQDGVLPIVPLHVGWLDPKGERRRQMLYTSTLRLSRAPMYRTIGYAPPVPDGGVSVRYSSMFAMQRAAGALTRKCYTNWALLVTSVDRDAMVNTATLTATAHKLVANPITRVRQTPMPATLHMRKGFMENARLSHDKMASRALMDMVMDAMLSGDDIDHGNGWFACLSDPL